jgi:signal transduction histidine kinase
MNLELVYSVFILTGFVIIGVLIYLRSLTQRAMRTVLEMIDLNTKLEYDLHRFLSESLPLFGKLKIDDFFYTIHYLDTTLQKSKSRPGKPFEKLIQRKDYQIAIGIVPRHSRGEQDFLNAIVLEILSVIIEMNVLLKIKVIHEALYKFSKLQTFILHDVKNLAQFIGSLSYNVHHLETDEKKDRFIGSLKETLPVISRSGAKIIGLLEMHGNAADDDDTPGKSVDLNSLLENLAKHYKMPCDISGQAVVQAEEYMIISIFDNLLKNIYEKSLQESGVSCHIELQDCGDRTRAVISDTGSFTAERSRLFQPFYTTKKGGLGIGLYQARNAALTMGGDIRILSRPSGVAFEVILPKREEG